MLGAAILIVQQPLLCGGNNKSNSSSHTPLLHPSLYALTYADRLPWCGLQHVCLRGASVEVQDLAV